MNDFNKKIHVVITFILMTAVGHAYSDYDNFASSENDNCLPCQPVCCNSCGSGFAAAGLVYWRPFENGLDTCVSSEFIDEVVDGAAISILDSDRRDPRFEWSPGFWVGAGYEFACSNWAVAAFWTHFNTNSHGSGDGGGRGKFHIDFDVVDILAAYDFKASPCFALRPFAGVRGVRIDQKLHNGEFFDSIPFSTTTEVFTTNKKKQNFWGVGPVIGIEGDFDIGCGFSLYAEGSVSWLYGKFDVKFFEREVSIDAVDICIGRKHLDGNIAAADAEIGVRWMTCFCDNMELVLQFGLEHHRYFNYNRIGNYGDLTFDGFNVSAGIGF